MKIIATIEHGTTEQVDACLPAAMHLEDLHNQGQVIDETHAADALLLHPLLRSRHVDRQYMPNMVRKIVTTCFASQRPGNRSVDPIGHILNKAWPMRCSVRNFSDIVSGYIRADPTIYRFTLAVMHASMLGRLDTGSITATPAVRVLLHRHYVHAPVSAAQLADWVQHGNHLLLFVAIKEFIASSIAFVPGLGKVLHDAYNWGGFVESVSKQANAIRSTINQYSATPGELFRRALEAVSAVRSFKCPTPPTDRGVLGESLQSAVRQMHYPTCDVHRHPLRAGIYEFIKRAVHIGVDAGALARCVGISGVVAVAIAGVMRRSPTPADWRALKCVDIASTAEAMLVHEFVSAWTLCFKLRVYTLPAHVCDEQAAAGVDNGRVVYACACCRQLRAFVVDSTNNSNAWARGHQKVLLNDETGQVYCGKRIEKNPAPRKHATAENRRSYWKSQQSIMCGYSPLIKIKMAGKLLAFFGKLYMLCPQCSCVMRLASQRYHGNSVRCVHCTYKAATECQNRCFHCYSNSTDLSTVALSSSTVFTCTCCRKKWMDQDAITSNIDEETAHQAINERWSTNRVAVYCACST
jgi:hypothetical protein